MSNETLEDKLKRYERALKTILRETTCDDTWDFVNRVLEGKEMTYLPYRINNAELED